MISYIRTFKNNVQELEDILHIWEMDKTFESETQTELEYLIYNLKDVTKNLSDRLVKKP